MVIWNRGNVSHVIVLDVGYLLCAGEAHWYTDGAFTVMLVQCQSCLFYANPFLSLVMHEDTVYILRAPVVACSNATLNVILIPLFIP